MHFELPRGILLVKMLFQCLHCHLSEEIFKLKLFEVQVRLSIYRLAITHDGPSLVYVL